MLITSDHFDGVPHDIVFLNQNQKKKVEGNYNPYIDNT